MSKEEIIKDALENINKRNITFAIDATHMFIIEDVLSQSLEQVETETKKQTAEEIISKMRHLPFHNEYKHDGISYRISTWTSDIVDLENELKSKYGIQETEKNE